MRILFLTQLLPYPLVGGAKIRAYYVLRHLCQQHELTLVSFVRADDRPQDWEHLEQFCRHIHPIPLSRSHFKDIHALIRSFYTGNPIIIERDNMPAFSQTLHQLLQQQSFDAVHADQTAMAQYALLARQLSPRPLLTVLDQHNALYRLLERQAVYEKGWRYWLWKWEAIKLKSYERSLCRQFDHILTVTSQDRANLLNLLPPTETPNPHTQFTVLPICIAPADQPTIPLLPESQQILHLGTMFWPPNVEGVEWFIRQVFPLIIAHLPYVQLVVAGKNPPPAIQRLASSQVQVTGFVPDPASLLRQSRVFIVPVRAGGGMRVKILDAWQWGIPIVSTTIGAEGIATQPNQNILIADTPPDFAQAVIHLLTDFSLAQTLRRNGHQTLTEHYHWRTQYTQLDQIYPFGNSHQRSII